MYFRVVTHNKWGVFGVEIWERHRVRHHVRQRVHRRVRHRGHHRVWTRFRFWLYFQQISANVGHTLYLLFV